jgi:hypothetical protein
MEISRELARQLATQIVHGHKENAENTSKDFFKNFEIVSTEI